MSVYVNQPAAAANFNFGQTPPGPTPTSTAVNESTAGVVMAAEDPPVPLRWSALGLTAIILFTAAGNLLVCMAVCLERRLQNITNYFLMSLSIADLLVSLVVMPLAMVVELFGSYLCSVLLCWPPVRAPAARRLERIDALRFLAGCCARRLNLARSLLPLSVGF